MQKHILHGPMTWEVTPRNVWKDIANLRTKRLHNYSMDDHQSKEENESVGDLWGTIWNHVGHMDVTSWSRCTNISVRSCIPLGCTDLVESLISASIVKQLLGSGDMSRGPHHLVLWLGKLGKKLPIGRQESRAVKQSLYTVSGWSPIQRWRIGNCWRIIKQFSNCPEMLALRARIGRPDIVHGLHYLARAVIKWNKVRAKRLARKSSHNHFATGCRIGFISGCPLCRWSDLKDSEPPSGGMLCIFGSHTFVPHSCTEAEIILIDAGPRLEGINLWDIATDVLGLPAGVIPCTTSNPERRNLWWRTRGWQTVLIMQVQTPANGSLCLL